MNVVYHPAVQREVTRILRHYDRVSGELGDAFWDELMAAVESILKHPDRYRMVCNAVGMGRAVGPVEFVGADLGRCPRLVWIRAFGPRHDVSRPRASP